MAGRWPLPAGNGRKQDDLTFGRLRPGLIRTPAHPYPGPARMSSPSPNPVASTEAAEAASAPRPTRVLTGIMLAVGGYVFFSSQDAMVKWLVGASLPVWQIL